MTRVKICGLTREEDVDAAIKMGADAVGFVFYPKSKRYIAPDVAKRLIDRVPPYVMTVGLFVNESPEIIERILREIPLSLLQFHGVESLKDCERYARPYVKAVRVNRKTDFLEIQAEFISAKGFLLDADSAAFGGSGQTFDWSLIPNHLKKPVILAGGLNTENIVEAIRQVNPYAVDVSSGVESQPGIKCHNKMQVFIDNVRREGSRIHDK